MRFCPKSNSNIPSGKMSVNTFLSALKLNDVEAISKWIKSDFDINNSDLEVSM